MPRATAISAGEAALLRHAIEDRFLRECPHVQQLKKNSYKESYRDLSQHLASVVPSHKNEFSTTRLRKLFYYSDPNKTKAEVIPSFGEMFLEGCYEYISEGTHTRESYLNTHFQQETSAPEKELGENPTRAFHLSPLAILRSSFKSWFSPAFFVGLFFGGLVGLTMGQEARFLIWIFERKHTWWICEYADGTLVYNNFRSYRSSDEVMDYFRGETPGDCRSFTLEKNESGKAVRTAMCFDQINAKKNLSLHGEILSVYKEPPK
ncbi:MAG: hypothetical protein AAF927_24870 [Bacteroidota bacterium]